jgi:hypothetical protein
MKNLLVIAEQTVNLENLKPLRIPPDLPIEADHFQQKWLRGSILLKKA